MNFNDNLTNNNNNIYNSNSYNNNSKKLYKFNFSHIIYKNKQNSDNKSNYNLIDYNCNICLMRDDINLINKLNLLSLLSFIENEFKNYDYIIQINNKICKLFKIEKTNDFFIYIRSLYRSSLFFNSINDYFYAYNFIQISKNNLINSSIDNTSLKLLKDLNIVIENNLIGYINEKKNYFQNKIDNDEVFKIQNIFDNLIQNNNENENEDDIVFLINKNWVIKAKNFIDLFIKNKNSNNENDMILFLNNSFDFHKVYNNYFNSFNEIKDDKNFKEYFPGLINNYNLKKFVDKWNDPDSNHSQDNIYILNNTKKDINDNFYLLNKSNWEILLNVFGCNHKIYRNKNDLYLKEIKCFIFDERLKNQKYFHLLKKKYFQISEKETLYNFKEKILRSIENKIKLINLYFKNNSLYDYAFNEINSIQTDEILNNNNNDNNDNNEMNNISNKYSFYFYNLPKKEKNILSELTIAYKNNISSFECDITKINNLNDDLLMSEFPYNINSDVILLIEIVNNESSPPFLSPFTNKCKECKNTLNQPENYCEKCNFKYFCSPLCSEKNINHIKFHNILNDILIEPFSLNNLFNKSINEIIKTSSNSSSQALGRRGLNNLGNTCYMNSVLQCLSNTEDLTKYFLLKIFEQERNLFWSNKSLISEYHKIINNLWIGPKNSSSLNITNFKLLISSKNNLFKEYSQQDAFEFLSFLLSSLNDELNRIINKKYKKLDEKQENEDDFKASERWWKSLKSREDSIIVDLFYGQFKSIITCSECKRNNITFDPFMILSLNLPYEYNKVSIKFFYNKNVYVYDLQIFNDTTLYELKVKLFENEEIVKKCDLNINKDLKLIESVILNNEKIIKGVIKNDNVLIYNYFNDGYEIVLYKKENIDTRNLYIYPISIEHSKGFFGNDNQELIYLSYPIPIEITLDMILKDLYKKIKENVCYIIEEKALIDIKDDKLLNYYILHNQNNKMSGLLSFFSFSSCEFCGSGGDYCNIKLRFTENTCLKNIFKYLNKDHIFVLLVEINYLDKSKFIYQDMALNLEHYKSKDDCLIKKKKEKLNLYDLLNLFNNEEKLNSDNQWFCNKCKKNQNAIKKMEIYKPPNYLIIHLKRFKLKTGLFSNNNKNNIFIDFPINDLNLSEYVIEKNNNNVLYDLYAIIEHYGDLDMGHYMAKCKNNKEWIEFNDSSVEIIDSNNIVNNNAYVLFYKKKGLKDDF